MKRTILRTVAAATSTLLLVTGVAQASNDALFGQQWGLANVNAESAWSVSRGGGVIIGIVDSGVGSGHPDLAGKVLPGRDFNGGPNAEDGNGHGTLVAGVAAAIAGNGQGIAGVAPDAKILPAKVFDAEGNAQSDRVAAAIRWTVEEAHARGSKLVLNLSFVGPVGSGGGSGVLFGDPNVREAIVFAARQGAAVVTAAGNDGGSTTEYDAPDGQGIIVVGAINRGDQCASFSNYGAGLDILAPGQEILSTHWNRANNKFGYASSSGTSMAVPYVSGALSMLMSNGMSNVGAVNRVLATGRGPAISCQGESTSYKRLDIAAALGASVLAGQGPAARPVPAVAAPRAIQPKAAPKPSAPVAPPPPPLPSIVLQKAPELIDLSPGARPLAIVESPVAQTDPWRMAATTLIALVALMHVAFRFVLKRAV